MIHLNLDADGFLLSASYTSTGGPKVESLAGFDLAGHRLQAHRWDGKKLVLDKTRLAELDAVKQAAEAEAAAAELQRELEASNAAVLEALEGLLTASTGGPKVEDLVKVLHEAKTSMKSILRDREDIRKKIKAHKEEHHVRN